MMNAPLPTVVPPVYALDEDQPRPVIDWERHDRLRAILKSEFPRLRELYCRDALRWIVAIEDAAKARDAGALGRAAHTLQGDSFQFGAAALGRMAEALDQKMRGCSAGRAPPMGVSRAVSRLRPMLANVMQQFERADDRGEQPGCGSEQAPISCVAARDPFKARRGT